MFNPKNQKNGYGDFYRTNYCSNSKFWLYD